MFDLDHWREILHTLGQNKARTFLTAVGVGWGMLMLVAMIGGGNGLKNGTMSTMGDFSTNSVYMWTQATSMPHKGFPRGRRFEMKNADIDAIKKYVPEIDIVAPRNQLGGYRGGNNVTRGVESGAFSVMGDYPEIIEIKLWKVTQGRFINQNDLRENRKVCVIGETVLSILFDHNEDPIGENVRINGVYFKVIGVYHAKENGNGQSENETIIIPFTTFQKAFNYQDRVGWVAMIAQDGTPGSVAQETVENLLKKRHSVHPEDTRAFGGANAEEKFGEMKMVFMGINLLVWFVGGLTLIAGAIGVSNIMLVIVKERTKEIGVRRAIGASPGSVVIQIVLESVLLNAVAGYTGLVLGVLLLEGVSSMGASGEYFANPQVDLNTALVALGILVVSGIFAGLIPAVKAVRIRPVDALRSE
jgi:putative ABC transport system permease protein